MVAVPVGGFRSIHGDVKPFLAAHPDHKLFVGRDHGSNKGRSFHVYKNAAEFVEAQGLATGAPSSWHEYVIPDRPCKLFVDLDDKKCRGEEWEALVLKLRNCVRNALGRDPTMRTWVAHTPEKLSAHLIFPDVWFDSSASLRAFAHVLYAQMERDDRMDLMVYSDSAFKSLRAPYCVSSGKKNRLVPVDGPAEFDFGWFVESLVTQGEVPPTQLRFACPRNLESHVVTEDSDPSRSKAVDTIGEWIRKFWSVEKLAVKQPLDAVTHRWVWHATPGVWCPIVRRCHAGNKSMIRGTFTPHGAVRIETFCLDQSCWQWRENVDYDWTELSGYAPSAQTSSSVQAAADTTHTKRVKVGETEDGDDEDVLI